MGGGGSGSGELTGVLTVTNLISVATQLFLPRPDSISSTVASSYIQLKVQSH